MARSAGKNQTLRTNHTVKSSAGNADCDRENSNNRLLEGVAARGGSLCTALVLNLLRGSGSPSPLNEGASRYHESKGKGGGDGCELHFEFGFGSGGSKGEGLKVW